MIDISEQGGCGCSLLDDEAELKAEHWILREDIRSPLADVISRLANTWAHDFVFLATFGGDKPTKTVTLTANELEQIIRTDAVGTATAYRVVPHAA